MVNKRVRTVAKSIDTLTMRGLPFQKILFLRISAKNPEKIRWDNRIRGI